MVVDLTRSRAALEAEILVLRQQINVLLLVCTENLIRVDDVMESPKLAE